ncbi:hypothetical protein NSQ91_13835 [Paenibacillus sp. FSL R7-0048]|uniref:Spore germination protein n=1 Tax=Paenibacillus odorifer TaxID=189426 RepID=A0AB36JE69_9BACL|nr:hypothetical protein [Paenibacillus odorifer]OME16428.1 hypothetical protein BSK60_08870 [Paenibacillus odorifer]OME19525.1 hypothetical protein BSK47_15935 [Paenibacillus odorifer]
MVIINFLDGTHLEILADTVLNGYKNDSTEDIFYLKNVFEDSIDGRNNTEGKASKLFAGDYKVGVMGFILSVDCFSVGLDTINNAVYLSTAVKSVENQQEKHVMQPTIGSVSVPRAN